MAYVTQAEMIAVVPEDYVIGATDDEGTGEADDDVWAAIAAAVDEDINGRLAASFSTPISPVPDAIKAAAKAICAYLLYQRRGVADEKNPWTSLAKFWRDKMDRIGLGKEPLTYDASQAAEPAILISEASRTHSAAGNLMV